jgi:hypothetical protein
MPTIAARMRGTAYRSEKDSTDVVRTASMLKEIRIATMITALSE